MSKLPELGGGAGFLTPKDFGKKKEMTVTVAEAPRIVPSNFKDDKGKPLLRCRVTVKMPDGNTRAWTMNNTSYRACKTVFGSSARSWIGKKIHVSLVKQIVRDKLRDVVYGEPVG
jgi:hypothetical protein